MPNEKTMPFCTANDCDCNAHEKIMTAEEWAIVVARLLLRDDQSSIKIVLDHLEAYAVERVREYHEQMHGDLGQAWCRIDGSELLSKARAEAFEEAAKICDDLCGSDCSDIPAKMIRARGRQ